MKTILFFLFIALTAEAQADEMLKQGVFSCEDSNYNIVPLRVTQHPTKPNKAVISWEGRDRVLHREQSVSGAIRYEGLGSKLLYIQTPHHSVLLDNNTMNVVLSECMR